ncbi:hypothetical protein CN918_27880 [Priestia megaterium]|nr:hypothetical protein CN918_27880 [Priestia megaterium]
MKLFRFLFHYGIAVIYLWIPEDLNLYYGILLVTYLFFYSVATCEHRPFPDVHAFLLGYGATWCSQILSIEGSKDISVTVILVLYAFLLSREKEKEGNLEKTKNELLKSLVYTVFLPFSAFLCLLYLLELETLSFLIYYGCMYYGIYRTKRLMRHTLIAVGIFVNNTLLMVYVYYYLPFTVVEKGVFYVLFALSVEYTRKKMKERGVSHPIRI